MEEIIFQDVSFHYPDHETPIVEHLALSLSNGITSFVGQNGTGKSTLLLLAAGILLPTTGKVYLQGIDTAQLRDEQERQRYVSFIFQNMEFETKENVGTLLRFVYEHGFYRRRQAGFIDTLIDVFELEPVLDQKTQEISKGELQRTILAFSLLYGSRIIMLDEPIFAMEAYQKHRVMKFMTEFARINDISIYFSAHELEISQKYSDYTLLFYQDAPPVYGPTSTLLTREHLEKAYAIPLPYLKQKEILYRNALRIREEEKQPYVQ